MIIKHLYKHTIGLGLLCIWMLMGLCACSTDTADAMHEEEEVPPAIGFTYTMRLNGLLTDFNQSARATHSWADGSKLYLQFIENGNRIQGSATFNLEEDTWTVSTTSPLTAPDDAYCEVYYFTNPSAALTSSVTLDLKTASYADKNGTYILEEDDAIAVTASLSPLTGRIRFVGTPKTTYKISGLSTYNNYNVTNNTFTTSARNLSVVINEDGSSDYYYALFEETPNLVIIGEGKSAYMRSFADHVLTAGSSGFVTLPTENDLGKWSLVNADNLKEITLPIVSTVVVSTIRSKSAGVSATVTSLGNGTILESGILCSTSSNPTVENSTKYDAEQSQTINLRVKNLTPMTTYYVCAYVRNERGVVYSEISNFTTISAEGEGPSFSKDDYNSNEDKFNDSVNSSDSQFDKDEHGVDDDLNNKTDSNGSQFGKTEHDNDDDLNTKTDSSNSQFNKDGHEADDDLNTHTDSKGSQFDKNDHSSDDDLNNNGSTSGSIDKDEYDADEELNNDSSTEGDWEKDDYTADEDWN